jgi:hypothetical protein
VPVFSKASNNNNDDNNNSSSLLGVWAAGLIFEPYNKLLQSVDLANGGRIVMADKNGIKIADSDINEKSPFSIKPCNSHHLQTSEDLRTT